MNADKLILLLQTIASVAPQVTLVLLAFGIAVISVVLFRML
ncbi:hypothetical protein [Serratia fonticola]|nr:hypothetical protein [Serratia fonticola]